MHGNLPFAILRTNIHLQPIIIKILEGFLLLCIQLYCLLCNYQKIPQTGAYKIVDSFYS